MGKIIVFVCGGFMAIAGAARGDVSIFGRNHSPIGAATLTANPDGTLAVDNLGSSGQDGVQVDLSDAPADFIWEAEIGGASNPLATPGAFMKIESIGTFNGATGTEGGVMTVANNGGNGISMNVNFLDGDPDRPIIVDYELNGVVVAADQVTGSQVTVALDKAPDNDSVDPIDSFLTFDIKNSKSSVMTTINGETVTADMIDVFGPYKGGWTQESAKWLAGGTVSSFTIANETLTPEPAAMTAVIATVLLAGLRRRAC